MIGLTDLASETPLALSVAATGAGALQGALVARSDDDLDVVGMATLAVCAHPSRSNATGAPVVLPDQPRFGVAAHINTGLTGFDVSNAVRVCDPSSSDSLNGGTKRIADEQFALAA